jgi:hypothetical protein
LYWIAAGPTNAQGQYTQVNKQYDLIYIDKPSFQESASWSWNKVGTIQSNWFSDAPGQDLARGNMRFYRASYKDRWRRTNVVSGLPQRPLASEDVYALHNIVISEGVNYVGLHGTPYSNTFASVFGTDTNLWPSGDSSATATRIEYYTASTSALISAQYFFGSDGEWYQSYPSGNSSPVTHTEQAPGFFSRAFSITLPSPLPAKFVTTNAAYADHWTNLPAMVWHPILKVPTNGPISGQYQHTIHCGVQERSNVWAEVYNLVALNLPVAVHPSQLNLPTNFCRANKLEADYIYTWDTTRKLVRDNTAIYCNLGGEWRFRQNDAPVPAGYFKPNDVLVIVSRNGGLGNTWTWTYSPTNFYTLPTRWMGQ